MPHIAGQFADGPILGVLPFQCADDVSHALCDAHGQQVAFVVGGRALSEPIRQRMKHAAFCDTLTHLATFANTLESTAGDA